MVDECGLLYLGFKGEEFTWERCRGKYNWVEERLDRGLANRAWCELFPSDVVKVLEVSTSDHLPLFLQPNKQVYVPRMNRFKFENIWLKESECINLVKNAGTSTAGQDIMDKIQVCCLKLEEWCGGKVQEYRERIKKCRYRLRQLRSRRDNHDIRDYNEVRWEYLNLLERRECYWKQRAKQHWLK